MWYLHVGTFIDIYIIITSSSVNCRPHSDSFVQALQADSADTNVECTYECNWNDFAIPMNRKEVGTSYVIKREQVSDIDPFLNNRVGIKTLKIFDSIISNTLKV